MIVSNPVFWYDFPLLVYHFLQLNVQRGEEDARELLDFVKRERKCKYSVDVVPNQLEEEFWLLRCTLVVSKC